MLSGEPADPEKRVAWMRERERRREQRATKRASRSVTYIRGTPPPPDDLDRFEEPDDFTRLE